MKLKRTLVYGTLVTILLLSSSIFAIALDETIPSTGDVFLYTGSPLVLSNGQVEMLDSTNPDLGATVVNSRTLLPLRAVSELFGAEVTYDEPQKEAVIKYNGKKFLFPINEKKYIVEDILNSKDYEMDSKSVIIDGRTMVPLRTICENVLGKEVSYYDRIIAVADHEINLQADSALIADVKEKIGAAVKARNKKELELALSGDQIVRYFSDDVVMDQNQDVSNEKSIEMNAQSDSAGSYSTTNTQVEGIDEADVVKTDGKYIYIGGNNVVRIVGADHGMLSDETAIRLATNKNVNEIYVADNRLVILGTKWVDTDTRKDSTDTVLNEKTIGIVSPSYRQKHYTFVDVYDITNPLKPAYIKGHEMEGSYQSSRKNGEIVYLVTNLHSYGDIVLPMMRDTATGNKEFQLELDDVMIMPRHPSAGYLIISAINVNNEEKTEVEAITAYGMTMYMNDSAMYLAANDSNNTSTIIKFALKGTKVGYAGSGNVKGSVLNQFSMDEYEENLRVATTTWDKENALYVLDPSLNIVGSVTGLAKGESIYSVRFMGDKGYIVTFRTIDPLFIFDLSNPTKPVVTGELKIPGFSNYLHPVGENLILGIGKDTYDTYRKDNNGNEIVIGTRQGGIKYSLFDVSDMGKPKEISKYVIGDSGSYTDALNNHKAIMMDQKSEKVALDAYLTYENQEKADQQGAVIISYDDNQLSLKGILVSEPSGVYGNDIPDARRILYIGDELYYIQGARITSYDYDNLKKIDDLVLQ